MSRRWNWIAFFAFHALASSAHSAPSRAADPTLTMMLIDEMSPQVTTLSREVTTYHWQPRRTVGLPTSGSIDPRDARAIQYFRGVTGAFWPNLPAPGLAMGNGLYVATDPVASQYYGGQEWLMLVVGLPAGTRLFDSRSRRSFSSTLVRQLNNSRCPVSWYQISGLYSNHVPINDACNAALKEATRTLGIQGVVYDWGAATLQECSIRKPQISMPAMVLIDPALSAGARALVSELPTEEPVDIRDLRIRITHFFRLADYFQVAKNYPWPSLVGSAAPTDLIEWIQSHTYFCDFFNWEDLLVDQRQASLSDLQEKREQIEEKVAILTVRLGRIFRPERFRGVALARFYTSTELTQATGEELLARPAFRAWWSTYVTQMEPAARARQPLSAPLLASWAKSWTAAGLPQPSWRAGKEEAVKNLVAELNLALFDPRRASRRDKPLLRDAEALILDYHQRFLELAPQDSPHSNERLARAVADYIAELRGWPPFLIRTQLGQLNGIGALRAILVMDKCLDRYARGPVAPGSDCDEVDAEF